MGALTSEQVEDLREEAAMLHAEANRAYRSARILRTQAARLDDKLSEAADTDDSPKEGTRHDADRNA